MARGVSGRRRRAAMAMVAVLVIGWIAAQPAEAKPARKPPRPTAPILVLGDSLADGIWAGLSRVLRNEPCFEALRFGRNSTGLTRPDRFDWDARVGEILAQQREARVALLAVGLNDRQPAAGDGRRSAPLGTDAWAEIYAGRIAAIVRRLAKRKVETFIIGVPIVRDEAAQRDYAYINQVLEASATTNGATFIPLWPVTADEAGRYKAQQPDASGKLRKWRADDGIHFTSPGYEAIAQHILTGIRARSTVCPGQ